MGRSASNNSSLAYSPTLPSSDPSGLEKKIDYTASVETGGFHSNGISSVRGVGDSKVARLSPRTAASVDVHQDSLVGLAFTNSCKMESTCSAKFPKRVQTRSASVPVLAVRDGCQDKSAAPLPSRGVPSESASESWLGDKPRDASEGSIVRLGFADGESIPKFGDQFD